MKSAHPNKMLKGSEGDFRNGQITAVSHTHAVNECTITDTNETGWTNHCWQQVTSPLYLRNQGHTSWRLEIWRFDL